MSDVGILTFVPAATGREARFRNDVAEIEGRLRFIFTGWELAPVFGGEPLHPADRAIPSVPEGRLHVHHVLEAGARVLLVLLVGDVDPRVAAAVVRYVDARVRPPLPLFVLGVDELGLPAQAAVLRLRGELAALGRPHDAEVASIREDDARFHAFAERVEAARDALGPIRGEARFRDDLRRHVHLAVCPGDRAPLSWRLPPLQALVRLGVSVRVVAADELSSRARWLLGSGPLPLDPRLQKIAAGACAPGNLARDGVTLAIRDLADERLAHSVALGPALPGGVSPEAVAARLGALRDLAGRAALRLCAATGDDDAGALAQHLLERATLRSADGPPFSDPAQARPDAAAATFAVAGLANGRLRLAVPDGLDASGSLDPLRDADVTAVRIAFGVAAPRAVLFEARAVPASDPPLAIDVVLPGSERAFLERWPADRVSLVPGLHAGRLEALLRDLGFDVTPAFEPLR